MLIRPHDAGGPGDWKAIGDEDPAVHAKKFAAIRAVHLSVDEVPIELARASAPPDRSAVDAVPDVVDQAGSAELHG